MNAIDGLPELPFEQILSYLRLEDVIKARAVSRILKIKIDNFRAKTLCLADRRRDFVIGKSRVVSGVFAQNFIGSRKFATFLGTFGRSILSNLNHLRLFECSDISVLQALNSFSQLKELDIIGFHLWYYAVKLDLDFRLSMLTSIRLERMNKIDQLTLDAPKLKSIKLWHSPSLTLDIVHGESVEKLVTDSSKLVPKLKNLKYLYMSCDGSNRTNYSTFPLNQLREIHLICFNGEHTRQLFDQMRTCQRADLKIYLRGLLLNGPDDPAISSSFAEAFVQLAESPWRLADEIPLIEDLHYTTIKPLVRLSAIKEPFNVLKRFTVLKQIIVDETVHDTERFLDCLMNLEHISELTFTQAQFWQELFDQLPEHCAVQKLELKILPADAQFLSRLKNLVSLSVRDSIDAQTVRKLFELPLFSEVDFRKNWNFFVSIRKDSSRLFRVRVFTFGNGVSTAGNGYSPNYDDLNAAIQFIWKEDKERANQPINRGCNFLMFLFEAVIVSLFISFTYLCLYFLFFR